MQVHHKWCYIKTRFQQQLLPLIKKPRTLSSFQVKSSRLLDLFGVETTSLLRLHGDCSGWELWKARRFSSTLARRWRDSSQTLACWCGNMSRGNNLERWSCAGYSSWLSCWYGIMPGGNNPERWNRTGTADYKRESMKRKRAAVRIGRVLDIACLDTHHRI